MFSPDDLRAILKRLQLPASTPIPLSSQATAQSVTIDAYLAQLMRQGYIEKHRVGTAVGHGEQSGTVVTEAKVLVCAGGKVDERRGKIGWRKRERTSKMGGEGTYPGRWDRR